MKTRFFSAAIVALALTTVSAKLKDETTTTCKQCGVTNAQITTYLQECSHHHTVFAVHDIPGSCNSSADIEDCGTATVYVSGGSIIMHLDSPGYCQ
jgi:hypothetical protein